MYRRASRLCWSGQRGVRGGPAWSCQLAGENRRVDLGWPDPPATVVVRFVISLSASAALLLGVAMSAGAATFPPGFSEQVLASGLTRPMDVAWAPDGRMFVIQKDGLLRVVNPGSTRQPDRRHCADRQRLPRSRSPGNRRGRRLRGRWYIYLLYTFTEIGESTRERSHGVSVVEGRDHAANELWVKGHTRSSRRCIGAPLCPAAETTRWTAFHPTGAPIRSDGAGGPRRDALGGSGDG